MNQEKKDPRQDPAFAEFMDKVLDLKPDSAAITDRMLALNLEHLERRVIMFSTPRYYGKSIAQMVLDLQRELKEPAPLPPKPTDSWAEKLEQHMFLGADFGSKPDYTVFGHPGQKPPFREPVEDQREPEPRAKNGALANRKTEAAKAKLPFYLKNRRF
jgi:hypothetical protein